MSHPASVDFTEPSRRPWPPAKRADDVGPTGGTSGEAMSFWDFVDIINPLQHIPIVSTIYREITGDTIRPEARILGGTLFGGPIGMALNAVDAIIAEASGKSVDGHVLALVRGEDGEGGSDAPAPVLAELPPETAATPAAEQASVSDNGPDAAPAEETQPLLMAEADTAAALAAPVAAGRGTRILPNGFPLTPRSQPSARFIPLSNAARPAATRTIEADPSAPVAIDAGLDGALQRLARDSAAGLALQARNGLPEAGAPPAREAREPAAPQMAGLPDNAQIVPVDQVPDAMMRALDLYRRQSAGTAPAPGSAGLDTRS